MRKQILMGLAVWAFLLMSRAGVVGEITVPVDPFDLAQPAEMVNAAPADGEKEPAAPAGRNMPLRIELDLRDGSRIVGLPLISSLPFKSSLAEMNLELNIIERIAFNDEQAAVSVTFKNGDSLKGALVIDELGVETLFGRHVIPLKHVVSIGIGAGGGILPSTLRKSLVLHYSFDMNDVNIVKDKSGKGHDGAVHGAKWVAGGLTGGAYEFSGAGAYIETKENIGIAGASPWTMSAWVKYGDTAGMAPDFGNIISIGTAFNHWGIIGVCRTSKPGCLLLNVWGTENWDEDFGFEPLTTFGSVVVTYNGTTMKVFINGVLKNSKDMGFSIVDSPVRIGGRTGGYTGQYLKGKVDEVMIFDRELSDAEVRQLYRSR